MAAFAPAVAMATLEQEIANDFGDDFASRTVMLLLTDEIQGSAYIDSNPESAAIWDDDYVAFKNLVPGATFTVSDIQTISPQDFPLRILDATGADVVPLVMLPGQHFVSQGPIVVASGIVPLSGELVFGISSTQFNAFYHLGLDAPRIPVPEPGTALLLALGLAPIARTRRGAMRRH